MGGSVDIFRLFVLLDLVRSWHALAKFGYLFGPLILLLLLEAEVVDLATTRRLHHIIPLTIDGVAITLEEIPLGQLGCLVEVGIILTLHPVFGCHVQAREVVLYIFFWQLLRLV